MTSYAMKGNRFFTFLTNVSLLKAGNHAVLTSGQKENLTPVFYVIFIKKRPEGNLWPAGCVF